MPCGDTAGSGADADQAHAAFSLFLQIAEGDFVPILRPPYNPRKHAMQDREQELWARALWVEQKHGERGPDYIGEQVTRLAREGDEAGVATWRAIAERYDALQLRAANA